MFQFFVDLRYLLVRFLIKNYFKFGYKILPKKMAIAPHAYGGRMKFDFTNKQEIKMFSDTYSVFGKVMKQILRPGDVFIDCGANIGYYTSIGASLVGKKGRVIAIEANPILSRRIAYSSVEDTNIGSIFITNAVLTHTDIGRSDFYVLSDHTTSSVTPAYVINDYDTDDYDKITVINTTLDKIIRHHRLVGKKIRLLKINVNGSELDVLNGYTMLHSHMIDYIYIELYPEHLQKNNQTPTQIALKLFYNGYHLERKVGHNAYLHKRSDNDYKKNY